MCLSLLSIASGGSLVDLDGTFFIQMGIFFVMFIFLHFALFRPVMRMIAARREATEGTTEKAHRMKEEAEKLGRDVADKLREVRAMATDERNRIVEDARDREREIIGAAQDAVRQSMTSARERMRTNAKSVKVKLTGELGQLADAVASRITGRVS
jgi:F-type H+-transporting ATPase subunit b